MIRLGLSAQLLAASGQSQTSEFQRLRPALHPEEAQAVTDATPQPEHAPVLPRHRETAIDFLYPMHHLDRKSERADRQRFIDEGETKHVGKQCGALAQLIADAERSAVSEERAAVVKYLRDQAEYYRRNRNIGPYAAELAELFDRGDHRG
jgi:sulfur relay (sulfurtransferase) DsrC/TusE family protein